MEVLKGLTSTKALSEVYPVGSIYMSTEPTSPASLFGGSWSQLTGRFLIGVGRGVDDNDIAYEFMAGEQHGEYVHQLSVAEMPKHTHEISYRKNDSSSYHNDGTNVPHIWTSDYTQRGTVTSGATGSNSYHNNKPPYLAVYMWKRIRDRVGEPE